MSIPDFSFLYPFQKDRYINFWQYELEFKSSLRRQVYNDAILLPPKRSSKLIGDGGVVSREGEEIEDSWIMSSGGSYMGGSYIFDEASLPRLDGVFTYLGFISDHWGHFLIDFSTRLYTILEKTSEKYVFLIHHRIPGFKLIPPILRFLELLGLRRDDLLLLNRPAKFKSIIVPQQSYRSKKYYSEEYLRPFKHVISKCQPTIKSYSPNILFSRNNYIKSISSEYGVGLIDNFYTKNGYKIIIPEKESLDNQIHYINTCHSYSAISGTLIHNILLADSHPYVTIINKSYIINEFIFDNIKIKGINAEFLDFYACKYPISLGFGPFLLLFNKIFDNFIKIHNYIYPDHKYISGAYLKENVNRYINSFLSTYTERHKKFHSYTSESSHYFPVQFLIQWLNDIAIYEL